MHQKYVHGYNDFENNRLKDQANTLDSLLHHDTIFPEGSSVLEIGCGVGAQTEIICRNNPGIQLTSIDISAESIQIARNRCRKLGFDKVNFLQANVYDLPFKAGSFEHVFVCFVLEHLPEVDLALQKILKLIQQDGTLTLIEGDHGSAYFYPRSKLAQQTIDCLIKLQSDNEGDSLIGRSLYPLLHRNGYNNIKVTPRMVYADNSFPELVDGFTLKTFIAMVEGVRDKAIKTQLMDIENWNQGIKELKMTAEDNGVFCYTFFKAVATV